jgi:polyhydroxyalkanoate synthesis regulator protein
MNMRNLATAPVRASAAPNRLPSAMAQSHDPVTIKEYDNRRLYHGGIGRYVTLADLAAMVEDEQDFVVHDARTGDDITCSVLMKVIREQANHG